jgi:DNA-directed RNA polymerase subunit RPC12/RpoP
MDEKIECDGKHTAYQPTEGEFKCPDCGAKPEDPKGFYTDEPAEDANSSCSKMHVNDGLRCYKCDYEASGQSFAAKLQKKHDLVPCKHCKGKGLVPGKKK